MEGYNVRNSSSSYILVTLLTLVIFSCSNMKLCSAANTTNPTYNKTNTDFIQTSCETTTYPQICISSLSSYANAIQTSHRELANTALNVSLKGARSTSAMVSKLSKQHKLKRIEAAAVRDCVEDIGDTIDELQESLKEMNHLGGSDSDFRMSNIKTWVSAALTDEDTCMDGFDGVNGSVKNKIRQSILGIAKLTSNALSLINSLPSTTPVHSP